MSPIPQITRPSISGIEATKDLQLSDIQGVFRGRGIRVRDEGGSRDQDVLLGDDQLLKQDSDLDPKETSGAKPRSNSRAEQKRSRQNLSSKLPDFEEELPAFEGFLGLLRRAQRDRDYGNLKSKAGRIFPDPSVRHGALEAAAAILDEEGGDPSLTRDLRQAAEELDAEFGGEIRAGYNISSKAAERTGTPVSEIRDLRDFYRQAVFGYRTPLGTYEFLIDHAPVSLTQTVRGGNAAITPQEHRIANSVDFLLHCLADDLNSGEPSRDPVFLKAVNDGIRSVGFLTQSQQACRTFLEKYNRDSGGSVPVDPVELLRSTLRKAENEQSSPQDYLGIADHFGLPHDSLRINFITQLQEIVRALPPRVLPSENHRLQAVQSLQLCLDSLIESEFEEASRG